MPLPKIQCAKEEGHSSLTTKGLISTEYDDFRLDAQRKLANRLIIKPLVENLRKQPQKLWFEELVPLLDGQLTDSSALAADEKWFDGFEAAAEGLLSRIPERWRGGIDEFPEPDDKVFAGDPRFSKRAFLLYLMGRLLEASLGKGLIICFAQNGSLLAVVSPKEFGFEEGEEVYPLPAKLDPFPIRKFTTHWCEALGADRIWLALAHELEASLVGDAISNLRDSTNKDRTNGGFQARQGYDVEDKPFVDLACELLVNGKAKNPNHAVQRLEHSLWKELVPTASSFEAAVAGVGSHESKRARIYRKVVKLMRGA